MNNRYARVFRLCCNIGDILERLLEYLNKNTFIMVAIHGNPFFKSMRDAFNLLMRNIATVGVTNGLTSLQFVIFDIAISAGMGGLTYLFLPEDTPSDLLKWSILISVVGSFMVAATFFGVYSMAIDTLFLCFCECQVYLMYQKQKQVSTNFLFSFHYFFCSSGGHRTQWWNCAKAILYVTNANESSSQEQWQFVARLRH